MFMKNSCPLIKDMPNLVIINNMTLIGQGHTWKILNVSKIISNVLS